MSEHGGPEKPKLLEKPLVELNISQLPKLEKLLFSDVSDVVIVETGDLSGPIKGVTIQIDGSSDVDGGSFGFGAMLDLENIGSDDGVLDDSAAQTINFLGAFADQNDSRPIEDAANSYYFRGHGSGAYVVGLSIDLQQIAFSSCAPEIDDKEPMDMQKLIPLRHGWHTSIPAFNSFRYTLSQLISQFYEAQGYYERLTMRAEIPQLQTSTPVKEQVSNEPEHTYPTMQDVGGMEYVKGEIMQYIEELRHPEIMKAYGITPRRGVFLYGPGGTGKTMLAEAFQHEISADMIRLDAADIYDMWLGNSEKAIKKVFNDAQKVTKPTIIYFNEIDGIITPSGNSTDSRVVAIFKQGAESLTGNPNAILWADSNKNLDELDKNILRSGRFDIKLHVPVPDERSMAGVIGALVARSFDRAERVVVEPLELNYKALAREACAMPDMTGSDIENILKGIIAARAMQEVREEQVPGPISQDEFVRAIRDFRNR